MRILAFAAVKGGVGKTTAAVNVAAAAALQGLRSVVWDLDPQAAACHLSGVEPLTQPPPRSGLFRRPGHHRPMATAVNGLAVIPAITTLAAGATLADTKHLGRVIAAEHGNFELLVLDLPAGVDSAVTAAVGVGAEVVVPIVPSMLAVRSFEQFADFVVRSDRSGTRVRGFVSMVDPMLARHAAFVSDLRADRSDILSTWIPQTVEIERACERRQPVAVAFPGGRAAAAFNDLWKELSRK
jgi:chromosome partitioning protein